MPFSGADIPIIFLTSPKGSHTLMRGEEPSGEGPVCGVGHDADRGFSDSKLALE